MVKRKKNFKENKRLEMNEEQDNIFTFSELADSLERSVQKIHEWFDITARYAYFKEKIIGKKCKQGKRNNFYWLDTNNLYIEEVQRRIKTDRDYWISAAEVLERVKDKDGNLVFREKWITSIGCHFIILDLQEASKPENLGLNFTLYSDQMKELVLEHCRQRNLPRPIMWYDGEEVTLVWPLEVPYYKAGAEINHYCNYKGDIFIDDFAFNYEWNAVQDLLYEDLKYLGANSKKKHALTMLRVPGTFNTKTNMPVCILHDAEKTTIEDLNEGLKYVREMKKRGEAIERPDHKAKLQEFRKDHKEFMKFCKELDAIIYGETKKTASKSGSKKSKAKTKTKANASISKNTKPAQNTKQESAYLPKIEPVKSESVAKTESQGFMYFGLLIPPERYDEFKKFREQIKQDVWRIHYATDRYSDGFVWITSPWGGPDELVSRYVCIALKKGENGAWKQIFVRARELEEELIKLWLRPDFYDYNIYVSQSSFAAFYNNPSRKIEDVASLNASFLDIDGKFAKEHKDLTPEEWSNLIIDHCRKIGIPLPNVIVFSGNGLHVKWIYKEAVGVGTVEQKENLARWTMLQKKLWEIFKDFGADSQAKDASRVLRVPGTKNCKPGTVDSDVRVVYSNAERAERYDFEDLAARILDDKPCAVRSNDNVDNVPDVNNNNNFATVKAPEAAEVKVLETPKIPKVEIPVKPVAKPKAISKPVSKPEPEPVTKKVPESYFCIFNETTGTTEFVKKQEMSVYLSRQDKTHILRRSIAELWKPELKAVKRIYCNYAVLSAEKVPGRNFNKKAASIRKHCAEYWNGLGFQEPNAIMLHDGKLIAVWKYASSDYLPGRAITRWQRTQEIINYHFQDWGARDDSEYQEVTALLPVLEFTGNACKISTLDARYKFDDLASQILRYTQQEVRDYKKKKAEEKAKAKQELKALAKKKRKSKGKSSEEFDDMAGRRFGDILKLIELRKDSRGEVPEGHRELSVFWAMNFAAQAGLVSNVTDFDALAQRLIDENGLQFRSESSINLLSTLKARFINKNLYKAVTGTLIDQLGITPAEQAELEVLREIPKKDKEEKKDAPKAPSLESLKLWEAEGISRRTWYRRRKAEKIAREAREAEEQKTKSREHELFTAWIVEKVARVVYKINIIDTAVCYIMRGGERESHYSVYSREFGAFERLISVCYRRVCEVKQPENWDSALLFFRSIVSPVVPKVIKVSECWNIVMPPLRAPPRAPPLIGMDTKFLLLWENGKSIPNLRALKSIDDYCKRNGINFDVSAEFDSYKEHDYAESQREL